MVSGQALSINLYNDNKDLRKTKIVATVGPASREYEKLKQLIVAGVNVFRLNFSHGSHAEHLENLKTIRKAAEELNSYVAVLQDLSGPKIRITDIEEGFTIIKDRQEILLRLATHGKKSTNTEIFVERPDPCQVLKPKQTVLLSDGIIVLEALEVTSDYVKCYVKKGGRLRAKAGIAFPESEFMLPATTDKDLHDLEWGIANGVDYVAISFVNNAEDVIRLRDKIKAQKGDVHIISKIERKVALDNIDEILDASDGLMVARGDLGLELPLEMIPHVQRDLIAKANERGLPVIVATQMLHSMIDSIRPTRAEASDIAVAVMSGADAVMLSEETAIGQNPVEAVEYLVKISQMAENYEETNLALEKLLWQDIDTVPDGIAFAACAACRKLQADAIIVCTRSGKSARLVSKYRPRKPIFVVSPYPRSLQRMALIWGSIGVLSNKTESRFEEVEAAITAIQNSPHAFKKGARIVITNGLRTNLTGSTNMMEVREIV
jgi:pyruvate kinase